MALYIAAHIDLGSQDVEMIPSFPPLHTQAHTNVLDYQATCTPSYGHGYETITDKGCNNFEFCSNRCRGEVGESNIALMAASVCIS